MFTFQSLLLQWYQLTACTGVDVCFNFALFFCDEFNFVFHFTMYNDTMSRIVCKNLLKNGWFVRLSEGEVLSGRSNEDSFVLATKMEKKCTNHNLTFL